MYYFALDPIFQLLSGLENPATIIHKNKHTQMFWCSLVMNASTQTCKHTYAHMHIHTHTSKQGKWSCQTSNNFFLIAEFIVLSVLFIFLCSCNMSCQLFYSPRISLSCFLEAVWYTKVVVVAVHMKLSIQRPHQLWLFLVSVVFVYTTLVSLGSCVWHWIRRFWVFCSNFSSQVWFLLPTE